MKYISTLYNFKNKEKKINFHLKLFLNNLLVKTRKK
jgi:hypothetical protein